MVGGVAGRALDGVGLSHGLAAREAGGWKLKFAGRGTWLSLGAALGADWAKVGRDDGPVVPAWDSARAKDEKGVSKAGVATGGVWGAFGGAKSSEAP